MVGRDTVLRRREGVKTQPWEEALVLVCPATGRRHRLNPVAARVWELAGGELAISGIAAVLEREFDASPERLLTDVTRLVETLVEAGLLVVAAPTSPAASPAASPAGLRARPEASSEVSGEATPPAREGLIRRMEFELTARCNLRCRHCFLQDATPGDEMTTAEVARVLDDLGEAGCDLVNFTGGEATLRPDLPDLIAAARASALRATLITNGTTMTPTLAGRLAGAGLGGVEISLHGATAETHDSFAGLAGAFDRAKRALALLAEAGVPTSVMYVVTRQNYHEYRRAVFEIGQLTPSLGFSPLLYPTLRGGKGPLALRLGDDQLIQLMRDGLFRPGRRVCSLARGEGRIGPDGTLFPCGFVTVALGNLRTTSFRELWRSAACEELRRAAWINETPPACARCERQDICPRCPGLAFLEDGEKMIPHLESCRITRLYREVMAT